MNMNYFSFYNKAKELLIDSLASLWFKGQAREQEYIKRVLTEDEPLFAEPVFQSIFPWEESVYSFEAHSSKLGLLTSSFVNALSNEGIDKDLRFPLDRHPYKHQTESWRTMLSPRPQTIVVTSGTGSGKTECFMIPVLQDLAKTNMKDCVQAIFLYPLNALMKSQQKRIHAWCKALPEKVTYAIYNGETDKENRSDRYTAPHYPQLVTRPQIRRTPPQILFTNPTMLNYMLVRAEDHEILEKSKGKLKWILLDEAHTYIGSSAAELSLQIRRVLDAFGVTIDQVNFAVTSATIGDESDPKTMIKLKTFVSQLTGKPFEDIKIIGGKRIIPELNKGIAEEQLSKINKRFGIRLTYSDIERLRKKLNSSPVLKVKEIGSILDKKIGKITSHEVAAVVSSSTGIPIGKIESGEKEKLLNMEDILRRRVVGQDNALKVLTDAIVESRSGMNKPGQPIGSFFLLGPTGTGKTELAKTLAEALFNDEKAMIRFDMSEFKEEHSAALLLGAPPGYVGYEEGGVLVNRIRRQPYAVVLFDEIEKAHSSVYDIFLQIMDEGKLHDRLGKEGDFSNSIVLFTSNVGSEWLSKQINEGKNPSTTDLMEVMGSYFRPEFLARLSEIVPFSPINETMLVRIFEIQLKGVIALLEKQHIDIEITEKAKNLLATRGFTPKYGARQVAGTIRNYIRRPISKMIVAGTLTAGNTVVVDVADNGDIDWNVK